MQSNLLPSPASARASAGILPAALRAALLARADRVTRFDSGFGLGGLALLFLSRYRATGQASDRETARNITWQCIQGILADDRPVKTSLIEYCEVAQLLRYHAVALDLADVATELLPVLDALIERGMLACFTAGQLDPYTGGFNAALYLLLNTPDPARLRRVWLRYLPDAIALARHDATGRYTIPSGISHGLAFYATFVAGYLTRYPHDAAFVRLGNDYLNALELRREKGPEAGCFYRDGGQRGPGRLSLAYGDAGILFAGYRLADTMGQSVRAERFLDCLEVTATRRSPAATGITTDGLLYGRSGAWLFFHRLHELSGRPAFREAATYWQTELRNGRTTEEPMPAFTAYDYGAMQTFSLFEGAIGPPLTAYAIATDPTFLYLIFYLQ